MPSRSQRVSAGKDRPKCFRVRPFFFCEGKTSRLSEKAVFIPVEKSGNYESRNTRGKGTSQNRMYKMDERERPSKSN